MRVGVIGLGGMGQSHVGALKKLKAVSEVIGCDVNPAMRKAALRTKMEVTATVEELLARKPQAVFVVTPPVFHAECVRACFEAGVPVFTEKPIAATIEDSRKLVAAAKGRKLAFQVGFELRYCGLTRAMRAEVDSGRLGAPVHLSLVQIAGAKSDAQYMTQARTGGIFYEKLCHQIDIFRYWLGEPTRVMAYAPPVTLKHYGIPDNITAVLEFPKGRCGTISFSHTRASQRGGGRRDYPDRGHFYEFTLTCKNGALAYNAWTEKLDVVQFNHRKDLETEIVDRFSVREEYGEPVYDLLMQNGDFIEAVQHGRQPTHPASDALESMEWVERAEESLRKKGAWISA